MTQSFIVTDSSPDSGVYGTDRQALDVQAEDLLREGLVLQKALNQDTITPGLLERLLPKRYKQYQKGISSRT